MSSAESPDARDQYISELSRLFDVELEQGAPEFQNRVRGYNLGPAVFSLCQSTPQGLGRSRATTRRDGLDHIQIVATLTDDYYADYDGRIVHSAPGTLRIVDMSRPYRSQVAAFTTLNLMLPREALGAELAGRDLHGMVLTPDRSPVRLLRSHLDAMWSDIENMTLEEAVAATAAAAALAGGALGDPTALDASHQKPVERTLVSIARRFIDQRLDQDDLTPEAVGAHLGVSRRTLYRLFDDLGGVAGYIQARRLDRAFDTIVGATAPRASLADIAYANGFQSDAHFSRAFRARFGAPPGEMRERGLDDATADAHAAVGGARALVGWIRDL